MRPHRTFAFIAAAVVANALVMGPATAQDAGKTAPGTKPATPAAGPQNAMPPAPKPGPEHALLKRDEWVWEARVEMTMGPPGTPAQVSTGVETNTLVGGLWLVSDFKGTMGSQPFHGHGTYGYDTAKKKYVGVWVDSMSTSLMRSEGDYDPATNTLTMLGEGPGPDGRPMKFREVARWPDATTRVFTMYMPGPDGKEAPAMTITYKKKS